MIKFIPYENATAAGMIALDGDCEIGRCELVLEGYNMTFVSIDCSDDIITEGLARAAMNYGANRNAYIANIKKEHLCPAFIRLGFSGEVTLSVEIPEALASGCTCSHMNQ